MSPNEIREVATALPWRSEYRGCERPRRVDLRRWLTRAFDQGTEPLCTAIVVASLAEYLDQRVHGSHRYASVLFNYRTSRMLAGTPDRRGSFLSDALYAWSCYGLLEENVWPHLHDRVNIDPPLERFADALAWREDRFFRLDSDNLSPERYLDMLRETLAAELPVSIDFPLHLDLAQSFDTGVVTPPRAGSTTIGRHVVLLCGYDDDRPTAGANGAFLLQNSWGKAWGEGGFGWLPYEFVLARQVRCSWSVAAIPSGEEPSL